MGLIPQRCPKCHSDFLSQKGDDWSCLWCGEEFTALDVIRDISPFLNEDGESASDPEALEEQMPDEVLDKTYTYPEFLQAFFPNIPQNVETCPVCDSVIKRPYPTQSDEESLLMPRKESKTAL